MSTIWQQLWETSYTSADGVCIVTDHLSRVISVIIESSVSYSKHLHLIKESRADISQLIENLEAFRSTPTRKPNTVC